MNPKVAISAMKKIKQSSDIGVTDRGVLDCVSRKDSPQRQQTDI